MASSSSNPIDSHPVVLLGRYLVALYELALVNRNELLATAAVGLVTLSIVLFLLRTPHDPREPPVLSPLFPVVGHSIGLFFSILFGSVNSFLYRKYRANPNTPAVTLPLGGNRRIYVVQDPALVQVALHHKSLSLVPVALHLMKSLYALPPTTYEKLVETYHSGVAKEINDSIRENLSGEELRLTSQGVLDKVADTLNGMETARMHTHFKGVALASFWKWVRHTLGVATLNTMYGENAPFAVDEELMDGVWRWESNMSRVMMVPGPPWMHFIFCPEGYFARRALQETFVEYFKTKSYQLPTASHMIRARGAILEREKWTAEEAGLMELALATAATQNAVPAMFWLVIYVLQRPDYHQQIRTEVESLITRSVDPETGVTVAIVDVSHRNVEQKAPVLTACYHETLRLHKRAINTRVVAEDCEVGNYQFKKCGLVMIPSQVVSTHHSAWGSRSTKPGSPMEFNPQNFLSPMSGVAVAGQDKSDEASHLQKARSVAFIPFGGGEHLCPGQGLAFAEIMGFAGVLLLAYEFEWDNAKRVMPEIKPDPLQLLDDIQFPNEPVEGRTTAVLLSRRNGWDGVQWKFKV